MSRNYFKSGDFNAICDSCGFKFKGSQLKQRWDGFMVCADDWEQRHIADFIRAPKPIVALPWTRPRPTETSVAPTYVSTSEGTQDTDTKLTSGTPGNASEI